jgi:hypothetical protein
MYKISWQQTPAKLIQILTDQLQPNSQKITWLLTTSEMLQNIDHKSWSTKSSAKTRMKTHTHTHTHSLSLSLDLVRSWDPQKKHKQNLSLSLSLNFALQKLIARRKIKRKVLCFFPRPQNIILSTRWREKCARKPNEAAGGKKNTKTFAKHTRSTQQSEQNSGSSRAGERLASVFKKKKKKKKELAKNFRQISSTWEIWFQLIRVIP